MPIVDTIYNASQCYDIFLKCGRANYDGKGTNFSYAGVEALFNYLDVMSEDIGENIELDPVAWCCDYTEWESIQEFIDYYGDHFDDKWEELRREYYDCGEELVEIPGHLTGFDFWYPLRVHLGFGDPLNCHFCDPLSEYNDQAVEEMLDYIGNYTTVIPIDGEQFITQIF